jgi:hypothetical protein
LALAGMIALVVQWRTSTPPLAPLGSNGHLPEGERWRIVHAHQRLQDVSAVAAETGYSAHVCQRWITRHAQTNGVSNQRSTGRRTAMSQHAQDMAFKLLTSNEGHTAGRVARMLHAEGLTTSPVCASTLIRGARMAAIRQSTTLKAHKRAPAKGLTKNTIAKRLDFCNANKHTPWSKVMFSDRCKFNFKYPGTSVAAVQWVAGDSPPPSAFTPNHPSCINVYCGLTIHGVTRVHVVAGTTGHKTSFTNKRGDTAKSITKQEYHSVLTTTLLPEGKRIFGTQGYCSWILQQDNDPSHNDAATIISEWAAKHNQNVTLLGNWPPNSPDLNPIENLWAVVQRELAEAGCKTFAEFEQKVVQLVREKGNEMCKSLVTSMTKRIKDCLKNKGGKTKY